jgi:hypothetical protein
VPRNLNIIDDSFKHVSSVGSTDVARTPTNFTWNRNFSGSDLTIITDDHIKSSHPISGVKIAWLVEPEAIRPDIYSYIRSYYSRFDYVFTHNKSLLDLDSRFIFIPTAGCWISESDCSLYSNDKTDIISLIASSKNDTEGHKLRHLIARDGRFKTDTSIKLFGRGYKEMSNKLEALKNFKFSIVVENSKESMYFTEKIIDCFATGVIPIYWGAPIVSDIFNKNGILRFDNLEELKDIYDCRYLSTVYDQKKDAVEENFEIAKKYYVPEDHIEASLQKLGLW